MIRNQWKYKGKGWIKKTGIQRARNKQTQIIYILVWEDNYLIHINVQHIKSNLYGSDSKTYDHVFLKQLHTGKILCQKFLPKSKLGSSAWDISWCISIVQKSLEL